MRAGSLFLCAVAVCTAQNYRVETVAGSGAAGFAGDSGPAFRAELNNPAGGALDSQGRLYVADRDNNRVRRVDADGTIRTIAGTGDADVLSAVDLAVDPSGTLYVAGGSYIRTVSPAGTVAQLVGPDAGLTSVSAIALEASGSVLAAD